MKNTPALTRVIELVSGLSHTTVLPETQLSSLGLDSLDQAELTMALEEEFELVKDTTDVINSFSSMNVEQLHAHYVGLFKEEHNVLFA